MQDKDFKYGKGGKCPPETKGQAATMSQRSLPGLNARGECARHACGLLGIGCDDTLLKWAKQAESGSGHTEGVSTEGRWGDKAPQARERRAQAGKRHPQGGLGSFRGRARPATAQTAAFIDDRADDAQCRRGCRKGSVKAKA
jgi:hypothetical protein